MIKILHNIAYEQFVMLVYWELLNLSLGAQLRVDLD